jgi:alkanesulfonate monooxygenase SsuD/methylene tetrahydromethanopterin reductase-like flavin-dependent oxidoreductase (luciferase family)
MALQFGIFDHLERQQDVALDQQYDQRLELLARADALGFYAYHLAEHHQSRLCMAPSPTVFLSAAARHTTRLRLGALVYCLPFYHPLRLIEELCMLDHLSSGRLQIGIGRGITAIEHTYWGQRPEEAQARQDEMLAILALGLTRDTLTYEGQFYRFDNVPLELAPRQRPHPPFWYAGNAEYAARHGMHFIAFGGARFAGAVAEFHALWAEHRGRLGRLDLPGVVPFVGSSRHLVVADTDAEAEAIARAAWPIFDRNFDKRGLQGPGPETRADGSITPVPPGGPGQRAPFEQARDRERVVTGSPETVAAYVREYATRPGANYFVAAFQWGSITHAQALRSLELFGTAVMPRVATSAEPASA